MQAYLKPDAARIWEKHPRQLRTLENILVASCNTNNLDELHLVARDYPVIVLHFF